MPKSHDNRLAPPCPQLAERRRALLAAALALVLILPVAADQVPPAAKTNDLTDIPLEKLMQMDVPTVVTPSKFLQKTTEAPSSVTVVPAEDIKRYGYRTLAEILQSVQGFFVSDDRNYAFLGVRGINLGDFNSRILVLVNGHRINESVADGAHLENSFILDIDLIDRVEIVRGPGSALYGNNAFFGVINVITRQPSQFNGLEASGEYGAFDTYKGRVSFGKAFTNGLELLLSGSIYDSSGAEQLFFKEFNTPALHNGIATDCDGGSFASGFGSLRYSDFTLEGGYIHREKTNPTGQYSSGNLTNGAFTFGDSRLRTVDDRGYVVLKCEHQFSQQLDLRAQVYYDRSEYEIGYPLTILSGGAVSANLFTKEQDIGDSWGTEAQLNHHLWDRHLLTIGAEYRDDFNLSQEAFDGTTGQPVPGGSTHITRQSYGIYGQANLELLDNLHFNGGLRYDQYGDFNPKWDPRLALIYQPLKKSTFKAIYGTAFRAPNFWELSYSGFQNLKPEEIAGYELVYEQGIGEHLRTSLSGFYNHMTDLIVFENGSFTNLDADTKGTELALEGIWPKGLRTRASYSLQRTENRSSSLALPDSPEHLVKFNVSVPLWKEKIFAGLEVQYTSSRASLHTLTGLNGQPVTVAGETADGFTVLNLTLFSRELIKNLEFSASVYNLLDQQFSDPATHFHVQDRIGQDGRSFRLKLTYRF